LPFGPNPYFCGASLHLDFLVADFSKKRYLLLTLVTQIDSMIVSFGSKETEKIWRGQRVSKIPFDDSGSGQAKA